MVSQGEGEAMRRPLSKRWPQLRLTPFEIALLYILISGLWILSSDYILYLLVPDPVLLTRLQSIKGWFYVAATGVLLYLLINRSFRVASRTEEALDESEGRYRSLFENNHSVMLLIDPATAEIVDANPAACSFYGYSRAELTGRKITDINTMPAEEVKQEMERASREQHRHFEFRHRLADGGIREVEVYSGPIEAHGRQLLYSIVYDVTDRRRTRETIRKQNAELQEQARLLDLTYSSIVAWDMEDRICYWNHEAEDLYGWSKAEVMGQPIHTLLQTQFPQPLDAIKAIVFQAGHWEGELVHTRKDGSRVNVASRWAVQRDERGDPEKILQVNIDVTALKESHQAQHLLAEAGRLLSSARDYEATLNAVLQIALPGLADVCMVDMLEEDGHIRRAVMVRSGLAKSELAHLLQDFPPAPDQAHPTWKVLRTGRSELTPEVTDPFLESVAYDARHYQILRELKLSSGMVVPLAAQGRALGTIIFISAQPGRRYSEAELALAEELARRAALALDNARLFQAEQAARQRLEQTARQLERTVQRLEQLQKVTAALSEALTREEVSGVVVTQGVEALEAGAGMVALLDEASGEMEVIAATGYPAEVVEQWKRFSLAAPTPLTAAVRERRPVYVESLESLTDRFPEFATQKTTTYNALVSLPLIVQGRVLGGIGLSFDQARHFDAEDQAFILALAQQCAQALQRAQLYEAEMSARQRAEQAEARQMLALQEKEVLLREVNHRVKNNLQAVSNLLYLQSNYAKSEQTRQQLQDAQDRVKSIALIHEKLYQTQNFVEIDFPEYVRSLGSEVIRSYRARGEQIRLAVESDGTLIGVDTAVTLGIIVNELISNALKHAFPDERAGEIRVELRKEPDDRLRLAVSDDGVGFPPGKELAQAGSLGLQLVQMLVGHLQGEVTLERNGGTRVAITVRPM